MPTTGFFTDSTVCIGCKACEVACKEWNEVPHDGFVVDRHVVRQHGRARPLDVAAREVRRARARRPAGVGFFVRRLQALRARRLPRSVSRPDRSSGPNSAASSSSPTSATVAATAWSRARSASSIAGRTTAARSSARSVTTGRRPGSSRRAQRCARRSRFSSATSTSCGSARPNSGRSTCRHAASRDAVVYDPRDSSVGGTHAIFLVRGDLADYNLPGQSGGADGAAGGRLAIGGLDQRDDAGGDGRGVPSCWGSTTHRLGRATNSAECQPPSLAPPRSGAGS